MPRMGITFEEVSEASSQILSQGENPTIEKVRVALGRKGSYTTISRYINEWRRGLTRDETDLLTGFGADKRQQAVSKVVDQVWQSLREENEAALSETRREYQDNIEHLIVIKEELTEKLKQSQHEREDLKNNVTRLTSNLTELNQQHALQKEQFQNATIEIAKLESAIIHLKIEHEAQLAQLQQSKDQYIHALQSELKITHAENNQVLDEMRGKLEAERLKNMVEIENSKLKIEHLASELKETKTHSATVLSANTHLQASVKDFTEALLELKREFQNLSKDKARLQSENQILVEQLEKLSHTMKNKETLEREKEWIQAQKVSQKISLESIATAVEE